MSRRRSDDVALLDELFGFLRNTPWWVGPPTVLVAWLLFRFVIPGVFWLAAMLVTDGGQSIAQGMAATISTISRLASPWVAALVAVVWLGALVRKAIDANRLDSQTGLESVRAMHWRDFEQLLAEAFRRQGYAVQDTGPGADGGIDLNLHKAGQRTIVQAKQWKAWKVGVKPVRELFGLQHAHKADAAIFVTSGRFTAEARRFGEDNGMTLIDGDELAKLIASVQRHPASEPARAEPTSPVSANEPAAATSDRADTARLAPPAPAAARVPAVASPPACPLCATPMVERTARRGPNPGQRFWGCPTYPNCRGTREMGNY